MTPPSSRSDQFPRSPLLYCDLVTLLGLVPFLSLFGYHGHAGPFYAAPFFCLSLLASLWGQIVVVCVALPRLWRFRSLRTIPNYVGLAVSQLAYLPFLLIFALVVMPTLRTSENEDLSPISVRGTIRWKAVASATPSGMQGMSVLSFEPCNSTERWWLASTRYDTNSKEVVLSGQPCAPGTTTCDLRGAYVEADARVSEDAYARMNGFSRRIDLVHVRTTASSTPADCQSPK